MARHWVYIDIPSKTSRYTLFCKIADRPRFKNRTVRRFKPMSQSAMIVCVSKLAVGALADRPRPRDGPSPVHPQTPPETQNVSSHFVKWPADRPRPMGGPSAVQAISATRKNTSLDKFYLSRRTVRPSGPDRPPFNPFLTRDENMSLDIFTRVWQTVRPSRPDRPPLNS